MYTSNRIHVAAIAVIAATVLAACWFSHPQPSHRLWCSGERGGSGALGHQHPAEWRGFATG